MEENDLQTIIDSALHVDPTRKYWLVRTQGGDFYDHYKQDNFIGIGFNPIGLHLISDAIRQEKPIDYLGDRVKLYMPEVVQPRYAAAQLLKFVRDMKKKDIVIIPSESSQKLTIGEIQETPITLAEQQVYAIQSKDGPTLSNFIKRRKVKWLKEINRSRLDPVLYKLLYSHHIITEADAYADPIDNLLSDFYVKGDETHLVIRVSTEQEIAARALFGMGSSLLDLVDRFCQENGLDIDTSDVDIKLSLRSPGNIEFKSKHAWIAAIIGIIIIGVVGGGFKIHFKSFEMNLSTPGLIRSLSDYFDREQLRGMKQDMLIHHMKNLQIQKPEDLERLLNTEVGEENKLPSTDVDKESKDEDK